MLPARLRALWTDGSSTTRACLPEIRIDVRARSYCFTHTDARGDHLRGRLFRPRRSGVPGRRDTQRTGTLLAAHALVASFLGATTVHAQGLETLGWLAVLVLLLGLVDAAIVLSPWRLKFAVDARRFEPSIVHGVSYWDSAGGAGVGSSGVRTDRAHFSSWRAVRMAAGATNGSRLAARRPGLRRRRLRSGVRRGRGSTPDSRMDP